MPDIVERLSATLPDPDMIRVMNDNFYKLDGNMAMAKFDINELDSLYNDTGLDRQWLRNVEIGHELTNYTLWESIKSFSGFDIWKYPMTGLNYLHNALNNLYRNGIKFENMGEATGETYSLFDAVYLYDAVTYNDHTYEAGTEGGTAFSLMMTTADILYVGSSSTFTSIDFIFSQFGGGYSLIFEYWNGSEWTELTSTVNNLIDNTSNFVSNGTVRFDAPSDWSTVSVGTDPYVGILYWIRIRTRIDAAIVATAYMITIADTVVGLLSLSDEQLSNQEFAWCYYNNYIYVTIENKGTQGYEGNRFIKSESAATYRQNYFVYNNEFTMDYEDNSYVSFSFHITGSGSPIGVVTPGSIGQIYVDITNDIVYISYGTTSADWQQVGKEHKDIPFCIVGNSFVGVRFTGIVVPRACTIAYVKIYADTAPTAANLIVDVNRNGVTIFTVQANRPEIAAGTNADDSGVPDIVDLVEGDRITVDIDQVGAVIPGGNHLYITVVMT